jgi:pyruvate dehydrogenase E2 component (dihydrolipoamide acetyltransferase)
MSAVVAAADRTRRINWNAGAAFALPTHAPRKTLRPTQKDAALRPTKTCLSGHSTLVTPEGKAPMEILMPQLGETVAEGKITTWFKAIGDAVKPGDNLFEIETDKTSMEVPATSAGMLQEIRVGVGEVAPVGAIVAVLSGAAGETAKAALASAPAPAPGAASAPIVVPAPPAPAAAPARPIKLDPFREVRTPERNWGPAKLPGGAVVTPLARRLAGEAGIDLGRIVPSGPHGRIVARDVQTALAARLTAPAVSAPAPSADRVIALYEPGSYEEIPLDSMRRTIAARLTAAKQTIPHFYLTADVDMDRLNALRAEANAASMPDESGAPAAKLSINDFIIKALALALRRVPAANAVWAEDRILRFHRSDIAVAVAMEDGLVTPVVRGVESKSVGTISAEVKDLAARARQRKLKPAEIQGGASAISNLGMHGIREFAAIISPPHATILAVGAAARRPVETADGGFRFVSQMTVTLSCDHRVVDGALGAELLSAFRHFIEHPVTLMI